MNSTSSTLNCILRVLNMSEQEVGAFFTFHKVDLEEKHCITSSSKHDSDCSFNEVHNNILFYAKAGIDLTFLGLSGSNAG